MTKCCIVCIIKNNIFESALPFLQALTFPNQTTQAYRKMKNIDIFLDRLYKLSDELEMLGREFPDLYKEYDGNDFDTQNYLAADKLDNSILGATHEAATMIGFAGADIKELTDFIVFRKTFSDLTDQDFENIIDNPTISATSKLDLARRLTNGNSALLLQKHEAIQELWNKTFGIKKYQQVRNKFAKT